jgi:hypothetical protein
MTTKKRTSRPPKAEDTRQQPTQLGVVLREGIVTALAGAFKVGAEVGRVAARATNDVLDAAGRMTSTVQPEVPSRLPAPPKAKPGAKARQSANRKRQAKTARKPPVRSGARKTAPGRRGKTA